MMGHRETVFPLDFVAGSREGHCLHHPSGKRDGAEMQIHMPSVWISWGSTKYSNGLFLPFL